MTLLRLKTVSSGDHMTGITFRSRLKHGDIRRATRTAVVALLRGTGQEDLRPLRQLLWASDDDERLVVREELERLTRLIRSLDEMDSD